jgi:hypothetical protein
VRQERLSWHPGRAGRRDQQELDPANSPFGIPYSGRWWRMAKKSKAAVAPRAEKPTSRDLSERGTHGSFPGRVSRFSTRQTNRARWALQNNEGEKAWERN